MTLKEFVTNNVSADAYYESRFPSWNPRIRSLVRCPFHEDGSKPNLSVGLRNGGAHCHSSSCKARFGNIVHFEAELKGVRESLAAKKLYREFFRKVVSAKQLAEYRENLAENTQYLLKIRKEMGLSYQWAKKFQLGLDLKTHRITIPIYDQFGQCINVRFYRLPSERTSADNAKLYNLEGYGSVDLFPSVSFDHIPNRAGVFIMASEKEAMLARADGLVAFCSTAGEGSWEDSWLTDYVAHPIFIIFDLDKGGKDATKSLLARLKAKGFNAHAITLPFRKERKDWKDYADFRLKSKQEASEIVRIAKKLIGKTTDKGEPIVSASRSSEGEEVERDLSTPEPPALASEKMYEIADISSRADLLNKMIRTQGIVAAKSPNTYSIPWKFEIKIKSRPPTEYCFELGRELLRFVRANDRDILQLVQNVMGSKNIDIEIKQYVTVTEVEIIPTAAVNTDAPYVVQRCYYFGERIESNVPYYLEIVPTTDIRTQETIGLISKITPLSKSMEQFDFSPGNLADLSFFQPEGEETVWDKLTSVANEVSENYTRVYHRLDWTLAALLTWSSPIGWRFPNEPELQRGWLNTLALGDTETGKSKVCKALKNLFNCGVFVNGENCTFVGLVGGAVKMGSGQFMLRWGRIPLSDKQLVVLEELSGLSVEEISNMSEVRSSGIARLDKGGINSETMSRTRLLCLSNARSTRRNVGQNLYGVLAVQELIGHGEDIARFDIITTLIDREVSIDTINTDRFATVAKPTGVNSIAPDQFRKLIHFIWALTPEQIEFDYDAYESCLSETKRLAGIYHAGIPVFKGGSGRYKLGRIAASIACFQFSWSDGRGKIIVKAEHVRAASRLLELIYNKPSMGYYEWSKQMLERETVQDEPLLRKSFREKVSKETLPKVIESLIHVVQFSRDELCAMAGISILHADQLLGSMFRSRVLVKDVGNQWRITPAGKTFFDAFLRKTTKK